jgi:hypothetical protein
MGGADILEGCKKEGRVAWQGLFVFEVLLECLSLGFGKGLNLSF